MAADYQIIKKEEILPERPLFITILGHPGIGKTSLSFTMPKPLLIDFDGGLDRAHQAHRSEAVRIQKYAGLHDWVMSKKFEQYIKDEGFESIILDTVGTLLDDFIAPWLIARNPKAGTRAGGLTLSGWGQLSTTFNNIRTRIRELGLHVCAICHAKEEGDESNRQTKLAVKGGSADILYRCSDLIGYMYPQGPDRILDFNPTQTHVGKNTAGAAPYVIPSPESPDYEGFMSSVIEDTYRAMNVKADIQKSAVEEVQAWRDKLAKAANIDDVQEIAQQIKDSGLSKTVLVQVRKVFSEYLEQHGLEFNKEGKLQEKQAAE